MKKTDGLYHEVLNSIKRFCAVDGGFKITQFEKDMAFSIATDIRTYISERLPQENFIKESRLDKTLHPQLAYGMAWRACLKSVREALGVV